MPQIEIGEDQYVLSGAEYRRLLAIEFAATCLVGECKDAPSKGVMDMLRSRIKLDTATL